MTEGPNDPEDKEISPADMDDIETSLRAGLLLQRAAQLIDQRSGWTRDHFARDRHSRPVSPSSERAVRFCVGGALLRATHEQFGINFVLPRSGEQSERFQFGPLQQAYRLLGFALASLLLKQGVTVREEWVEDEWQLLIGLPENSGRAEAREERMTWETFVHSLNDDRRLKHSQILSALWVAMLHASVPAPLGPVARRRASREARPQSVGVGGAGHAIKQEPARAAGEGLRPFLSSDARKRQRLPRRRGDRRGQPDRPLRARRRPLREPAAAWADASGTRSRDPAARGRRR